MDWHELNKKRVADLRDMVKETTPNLQGVMSMKKDQLVELMAERLGIEKPTKKVHGIDKGQIKAQIRELKVKRQAALEAQDSGELKKQRRAIHRLKRKLRRAMDLS
jgi:hypothetical protein